MSTERNYVQRLRLLKDLYADPLRSYARSKDTAIIPPYEAKVLFGNIDQLVPANESFLRDLEQMLTPSGPRTVGGVGDVALHHFLARKTFDCYKHYYHKREEAQMIFKREIAKKSSTGFAPFIEVRRNRSRSRKGLTNSQSASNTRPMIRRTELASESYSWNQFNVFHDIRFSSDP